MATQGRETFRSRQSASTPCQFFCAGVFIRNARLVCCGLTLSASFRVYLIDLRPGSPELNLWSLPLTKPCLAAKMPLAPERLPQVETFLAQDMADEKDLHRSNVESVQADSLSMHQSAAQNLSSKEAHLDMSAAGYLEAERVESKRSALGNVQANTLNAELSLVGMFSGVQANLRDGAAGVIVSDAAVVENATAGVLVAREVHGTTLRTGVLLAGKVEGNVETLLDTMGAIGAGLAAGIGIGLMLSIAKMFRRK